MTLSSLHAGLVAVLQAHPVCKSIVSREIQEFSADQFLLKIRVDLPEGNKFQVRVYYNRGHVDYAYQLFREIPLLRWDNKEEFRQLETYQHHHHDEQGNVHSSPLGGDPLKDLEYVLGRVSAFVRLNRKCTDFRAGPMGIQCNGKRSRRNDRAGESNGNRPTCASGNTN